MLKRGLILTVVDNTKSNLSLIHVPSEQLDCRKNTCVLDTQTAVQPNLPSRCLHGTHRLSKVCRSSQIKLGGNTKLTKAVDIVTVSVRT